VPINRATKIPIIDGYQPSPPISCITFIDTTEEKTSMEPIDKSIPAVIMIKVMPTPRIANNETLIITFRRLKNVRKVPGAIAEKIAIITSNTITTWIA
jgi:hypothetical protein